MSKLSVAVISILLLSGCTSIPKSLSNLDESHKQAVMVQTNAKYPSVAYLTLWQRNNNHWQIEYPTVGAIVGRGGLIDATNKKEGDGHTPAGVYDLKTAFGYSDTLQTGLDYQKATAVDIWIDDVASDDYNRWVKLPTSAASFEKLRRDDNQYSMAAVIEYNTNPVIKGAGSAIFMHVWRRYDHPTAGCVGVSQRNLRRILRHLDKDMKPVIVLEQLHG